MKRSTRENIRGWGIMGPILVYFLLFSVIPIFYIFYLSFTDYGEVLQGGMIVTSFVGFKNFVQVFTEPVYFRSIGISFAMTVLITGLGIVFGFIIALMLKKVSRSKGVFRTIWYIPGLLSGVVLSQFVVILLGENGGGVINKIIEATGGSAIRWQESTFWMFFWIIGLICYGGTGGTAILLLAGLNGISDDVYEAAKIDGANPFVMLFRITLPLVRPMLGFVLINGFIGAFNIYEPVLLISDGGPNGSTEVILFKIYDEAFANFKYGFTSALSFIVMLIVLALTLVNLRFTDNSIYKLEND